MTTQQTGNTDRVEETMGGLTFLQWLGALWLTIRISTIGLITEAFLFPFMLPFTPITMVLKFWEVYITQRMLARMMEEKFPPFFTFLRLYVFQVRYMVLQIVRNAWRMEGFTWEAYTLMAPKWHHQIGRSQAVIGGMIGYAFISLFNWNFDRVWFDTTADEIADKEEEILLG